MVVLPRGAPIGVAYGLGTIATFWVIARLDTMFL
jgi:hypothetical protein